MNLVHILSILGIYVVARRQRMKRRKQNYLFVTILLRCKKKEMGMKISRLTHMFSNIDKIHEHEYVG